MKIIDVRFLCDEHNGNLKTRFVFTGTTVGKKAPGGWKFIIEMYFPEHLGNACKTTCLYCQSFSSRTIRWILANCLGALWSEWLPHLKSLSVHRDSNWQLCGRSDLRLVSYFCFWTLLLVYLSLDLCTVNDQSQSITVVMLGSVKWWLSVWAAWYTRLSEGCGTLQVCVLCLLLLIGHRCLREALCV